mmetsp:Transcript_35139/g.47990  ORF Transcript_35139/g.47990 Transcript_35139/m.47990 type:complete len:581 (+) Transcript_35139:176-1918(+)|eukprot:CAMPEP_0201490420 /NCGR_PEP_ID=MMETSP0151_2-20130828/26539_1 /ASSEMBLY_ACC=CAM_ASM_000257 /TAXON_ID=200890 /ORGANISM="Paramoeba atlantica, Strain 621/1 / CCAP 1560/9" /LENGTH=580 /DNA_ID=CAMNT_0047876383 /DNA_START=144 /DNA_END=1889 /DNA_ORIENTATION=-
MEEEGDSPQSKETFSLFDDRDLVRLMIQCLHSMGYNQSGDCLEKESKQVVEDPTIRKFRLAVLDGEWDTVLELLSCLHPPSLENSSRLKYVVYRQKYLELLEKGDRKGALECLRSQIAPLETGSQEGNQKLQQSLRKLSNLILCDSPQDLRTRASWDGTIPARAEEPNGISQDEEEKDKAKDGRKKRKNGKGGVQGRSREKVLDQIRRYIAPDVLVPENRLKCLITQAVQQQERNCQYHNVETSTLSLFEDHLCSRSSIPNQCVSVLEAHDDEVWYVKYSHNGDKLASCSRDGITIIWEISSNGKGTVLHKLEAPQAVSSLAWSADDKKLLVCGAEPEVRLWDVEKGTLIKGFNYYSDSLSACSWLDETTFVSGGVDKMITVAHIDSEEATPSHTWDSDRVYDLASSGKTIVVAVTPKKILLIDAERGVRDSIQENDEISSLYLSQDGRYLLTSPSNSRNETKEIHLWDLREKKIIQRYTGHKQCRFVIRSCLGGANEGFVLSGSEDGHVCVWHRFRGDLLLKLKGHTETVNSVSWNPRNSQQFASASDDATIRIWMPEPSKPVGSFHDEYFDEDDAEIN